MTKEKDNKNNTSEHTQNQFESVDIDYCHTDIANNLFWQELKTIAEDGVKQ